MTITTPLPPPLMILNIGKSGGGKTGALLALARAGFTLRIADFDNAAAMVVHGITHGADGKLLPQHRGVPERFDIVPFTDRLKKVGNALKTVGIGSAWERFLAALDKWPGAAPPGGVFDWGPDTVFVLDTLTHASNASLRHVMKLNNKEGDNPSQPNWGDAMRGVEDLISLLRFGPTKCHVIVNAHITFLEGDEGVVEGLPMSIGAKLSPKIPSFFPIMIRSRNMGGNPAKRVILTSGDGRIELKVPAPDLPRELDQSDGLAKIFTRLGWAAPPAPDEPSKETTPPK